VAEFPNTAFVIFSTGAFGGAEKRFLNLSSFLNRMHPGSIRMFVNPLMQSHIRRIFAGQTFDYIDVIGETNSRQEIPAASAGPVLYNDNSPDPLEIDNRTSAARKYYWYYKNKFRQKKLFRSIDALVKKNNIKVLIGIFAGGPPLVFYFEQPSRPAIIFSDMDSWFTDVLPDTKKLWYRKYYSFNDILEKADAVDFLSPYIAEGVKKRGVKIQEEKINIAPSSFIDYSKCMPGSKEKFEIAFAARLEPDKNPMLYLEAASVILKKYPEIKFHILGEGSLVGAVNNFISANDLKEKINFTFHKNPPEIFAGTSVFVSLQSGTNYPSQSVIEAMACGNAVIASNIGDTGLLINSSNGLLTELSVDGVVSAMEKLITDRSLTRKLGESGRDFVMQNHTIENVSAYYSELIQKVNSQHNRPES
jgi:glycosyltransferase involved in cell wall biosynthesis